MSSFAATLERFLYRVDEPTGPFFELVPDTGAEPASVPTETPEEFLSFALGAETYAVPLTAVKEILRVTDITPVPRAPQNLVGIMNVRGEVLPVFDVKPALRLADAPVDAEALAPTRQQRVVVVRELQGDVGLLVDAVTGVVKLLLSRLEAAPPSRGEKHAVAGLARRDGKLFILLDIEQVLS